MPLYEYKCQKCGTQFEKIERFSDKPLETHDGDCGGRVERLISSPSFHFKGSGWYVTDYAKGGSSSPKSSNSESKSESKGETKSETKTESKPAPAASSDSK